MSSRERRADDASPSAESRRFSYWLGLTLHEERERAGHPIELIAYAMGVSARTLERLEDPNYRDTRGEKPYGQDIDRVVATYAYVLGLDDARELWQIALNRWRAQGDAPNFMEDRPESRFLRPLREEAARQRSQARSGPLETRAAMRSLRAES